MQEVGAPYFSTRPTNPAECGQFLRAALLARQQSSGGSSEACLVRLLQLRRLFPDSEHLTIKPSPDWFGEQLHELAVAAKIIPWPRNGLRHTFGTFHYAKYRNENSTASEMGNTPDVVFKNYRALVKEPLVSQFWDLTPAKVLGPEVVFDQNAGDPNQLPATVPA